MFSRTSGPALAKARKESLVAVPKTNPDTGSSGKSLFKVQADANTIASGNKYIMFNGKLIPVVSSNKSSSDSPKESPILKNLLSKDTKNANEPSFEKFKYWCGICRERFCFTGLFQDHINLHSGIMPYECRICARKFATMLEHSKHTIGHDEDDKYLGKYEKKKQQCDICGKLCKGLADLRYHTLMTHEERKKALCDICGLEFLHLQYHVQKCHDRTYSYECQDCGKKFHSNSYLNIHKDKHNTNKRYCCDLCGKTFTFRSGLKSHKQSHIFVSCDTCKKNFMSKLEFKRHLKLNACSASLVKQS